MTTTKGNTEQHTGPKWGKLCDDIALLSEKAVNAGMPAEEVIRDVCWAAAMLVLLGKVHTFHELSTEQQCGILALHNRKIEGAILQFGINLGTISGDIDRALSSGGREGEA